MELYDGNNPAGIFEEDGSIKCIDCMTAQDWRNLILMEDHLITVAEAERNGYSIYCDSCQSEL